MKAQNGHPDNVRLTIYFIVTRGTKALKGMWKVGGYLLAREKEDEMVKRNFRCLDLEIERSVQSVWSEKRTRSNCSSYSNESVTGRRPETLLEWLL